MVNKKNGESKGVFKILSNIFKIERFAKIAF